MLAVRDAGEEDPLGLFPVPSDDRNAVQLVAADGPAPTAFEVVAADLTTVAPGASRPEILLRLPKIDALLHVTDSRLVVACSRYHRTGRWVGGPTSGALNRLGVVRAALRRSGAGLVGHVRYPWLQSIGYLGATGRGVPPTIRVNVAEHSGDEGEVLHRLDLTLSSSSAEPVAREILQRAVRHRLGDPALDARDRPDLLALFDAPGLTVERGYFSMWHFPFSYSPGRRSMDGVGIESRLPSPRSDHPVPASTPTTSSPLPDTGGTADHAGGAAWWDTTADAASSASPSHAAAAMPSPAPPAESGWHRDPFERHELRYRDGAGWTSHVADHGVVSSDPLPPEATSTMP